MLIIIIITIIIIIIIIIIIKIIIIIVIIIIIQIIMIHPTFLSRLSTCYIYDPRPPHTHINTLTRTHTLPTLLFRTLNTILSTLFFCVPLWKRQKTSEDRTFLIISQWSKGNIGRKLVNLVFLWLVLKIYWPSGKHRRWLEFSSLE